MKTTTLASFNRFAGIAKNLHARVIIQHSPEDLQRCPPSPGTSVEVSAYRRHRDRNVTTTAVCKMLGQHTFPTSR